MKELSTSYIAKEIDGTLIGPDKSVDGIFNFLNSAKKGDAVIRHWINEIGVEMAVKKGVSCLITQNPRDNAIKIPTPACIKPLYTPIKNIINNCHILIFIFFVSLEVLSNFFMLNSNGINIINITIPIIFSNIFSLL